MIKSITKTNKLVLNEYAKQFINSKKIIKQERPLILDIAAEVATSAHMSKSNPNLASNFQKIMESKQGSRQYYFAKKK